jgi:hypothetical protein
MAPRQNLKSRARNYSGKSGLETPQALGKSDAERRTSTISRWHSTNSIIVIQSVRSNGSQRDPGVLLVRLCFPGSNCGENGVARATS